MKCHFLLIALATITRMSLSAADATKPNVLFILMDDFGSRDLGCYGSALYETSNMDQLAKSVARFTQADVAYPRCVPSRFAYFTDKRNLNHENTIILTNHSCRGASVRLPMPLRTRG